MSDKKTILIVEDDETISNQLEVQLEILNFSVAGIAETGSMAIQMTDELKPDLVLMDIYLEGEIDGIETASIIKDKFAVPVIFITGTGDDSIINRAQISEPYGYIIKPVNTTLLNASIITALNRRRLENKIRQKEEQYQDSLNALSANICVIDETGTIVMVNNTWKKFARDNSAEPEKTGVGCNYLQICRNTEGEDRDEAMEFAAGIIDVLSGIKGKFSLDYTRYSTDNIKGFTGTVTPLPDRTRGVIGAVIAHESISESKWAEKRLQENEKMLSSILNNIMDVPWSLTWPDLKIIFIGPSVENIYGITAEEFYRDSSLWQELTHPDDRHLTDKAMKQLIKNGTAERECRVIRTDGSIAWIYDKSRMIFNEKNIPVRIDGIVSDITTRKNAELELEKHRKSLETLVKYRTKELSESEKRYKYITESITDYVYQVKIDENNNKTIFYSEGCFKVTGYHASEFMDNPSLWLEIVHEEDRPKVKNFSINIAIRKKTFEKNITHRIIHRNGTVRWLTNTVVIQKRPDGRMKGYDVIIRDISEIKNAEDEIRRLNSNLMNIQEEERQRVAKDLHDSVGQTILAAKINIDTYRKNPQMLENRLDIGLSFLMKASRELREIYMNLYPSILNDLGLEMTIRWLVSNTMEPAGITSTVEINLNPPPPNEININLYRIIQELISNVLKHAGAGTFNLFLYCDDEKLELTVKDNGKGINARNKSISGYGLSNIKNRVSQLKGVFVIEKNKPHGTSINILIHF